MHSGTPAIALFVAAAVALIAFVFSSTDDRPLRMAVILVVAACGLLALDSFVISLCGLAENRSDLYEARCSGGVPSLPLVGVPILLLLAIAALRWGRGWRLFGLAFGALVFAASVVVPWALLQV